MSVKSISKTMDTLDYFLESDSSKGISLKEICDHLGFKKSAAHHMLATICDKGYLYQDLKSKKYFLGSKLKKFGEVIDLNANSFINFADPFLKKINDATGEAVHLASFEGTKLITLSMLESTHPVRVDHGFLNKDNAFHATASGKAMLAYMSDASQKKILKNRLEKFTSFTITNVKQLSEELKKIKKNGFSTDDEEFQPGVFCVGYPIFDNENKPFASISCSSPKFKITSDKKYLDKIKNSVKFSALEIGKYFKKTRKKGDKHAA